LKRNTLQKESLQINTRRT